MGDDSTGFKLMIVRSKQQFHCSVLVQRVLEKPYGFGVGNSLPEGYAEKTLEADPVRNLVFGLIVRKIEKSLQNELLEHHHAIERVASRVSFSLFFQHFIQNGAKALKVYDIQSFKGVSQLA